MGISRDRSSLNPASGSQKKKLRGTHLSIFCSIQQTPALMQHAIALITIEPLSSLCAPGFKLS